MRRRRTRSGSEEGAIAVTTAILLVALILMSAVVVDLGYLRVDHRDSQSVADLAATAGASAITGVGDRVEACELAWDYLVNNLEEVPNGTGPSGDDCAAVFSSECSNVPPADLSTRDKLEATLAGGAIEVVILSPVYDFDDVMQPGRQAIVASVDGVPCDRISVQVRRNRSHLLAGVAGFSNGSSIASAVARSTDAGLNPEYATLIILRARDCESQNSAGGTGVIVFNHVDQADGKVTPGVITADSLAKGSCGTNKTVYLTTGGGGGGGSGGYLCAGVDVVQPDSGGTELAVAADQEAAAREIDETQQCELTGSKKFSATTPVTTTILDGTLRSAVDDSHSNWRVSEGTAGSVSPDASYHERVTRQAADHAYNCGAHDYNGKGIYPPFNEATNPQYPVAGPDEPEIPDCTTLRTDAGGQLPAIDRLKKAFIDDNVHVGLPTVTCTGDAADMAARSASQVIVDCKTALADLALPAARVVYMVRYGTPQRGIALQGTETFTVGNDSQDTIMVVPKGGISMSGGSLYLKRTMTYLHDPTANFSVTSDETLEFTAPQGSDPKADEGWVKQEDGSFKQGSCNETTLQVGAAYIPSATCFENLTFWDNGHGEHKLAGGASIEARGVFFFPRGGRGKNDTGAGFSMQGSGSAVGLDLTNAQMFTWRLGAGGQKPLLMRPNPDIFLETPAFGVGLIR